MCMLREVPPLIRYGLKMYLLVVDSPLHKPVLVMAELGPTQILKCRSINATNLKWMSSFICPHHSDRRRSVSACMIIL
jgi:hypothetical protein